MHIKAILNRIQKQPGFTYGKAELVERREGITLRVRIHARRRSLPVCSKCMQKRPGYDTLNDRTFEFVPLWAIAVFFLYAPRRADCPRCGVTVELMPWANGKSGITTTYAWFLSSWAKSLSWAETARRFRTSWQTVFRSVTMAVDWGRSHANYAGITSIGVDEIAWKKGHKYLTVAYQIDHGTKRLLWIGRDRTMATFNGFFDWLGKERTSSIRFIATDMWRAFLTVSAKRAPTAMRILDRFHIAGLFSKAIEKVRRDEVVELRRKGRAPTLTKTRWVLLKRTQNLTEKQRGRLSELLRVNLRTVRAYLLKEDFHPFWGYVRVFRAARFLDQWTAEAMRSRIEPMKKVAQTLRTHQPLLLNWFRARGAFSHGATEGLNNKARVTTRRAYGFRTYGHAEIALFHTLGALPEPDWLAHRFW